MKTEAPPQVAVFTKAMVTPRKAAKNCNWGPHCPICNNEEEHREEFTKPTKNAAPRHTPTPTPELPASPAQHPQLQNVQQDTHCPQLQNFQHPQPQQQDTEKSFDIPDRYAEQIKFRREWEEKIERLNEKYSLNCFSSSELDSETDSESEYWYNHKYETHIKF